MIDRSPLTKLMDVDLRICVHVHGIRIVGRSTQWQEQAALLDHLSSEVSLILFERSHSFSGDPCSTRQISKGCGANLMVLDPLRFPLGGR